MDTKHHLSFVASITESLTQHNPVLNIRSTCAQLKSTHTKNTLFPDFASGQERAIPAAVLLFTGNPFIFPEAVRLSAVAQLAGGVLLPGGKAATVLVWSWVNFGERRMVIFRERRRLGVNTGP